MTWYDFFMQGGYAFYVWGSYAIALIVIGGEVILVRQRRKALRARHGDSLESSKSKQL